MSSGTMIRKGTNYLILFNQTSDGSGRGGTKVAVAAADTVVPSMPGKSSDL